MQVSIAEAAIHLGVSQDTVRRRIRKGVLDGHKTDRPQGFVWIVDLPEENPARTGPTNGHDNNVLIELLTSQIEAKDRQIDALLKADSELRQLLAQRSLSEPHRRRKSAFVSWVSVFRFWRKE